MRPFLDQFGTYFEGHPAEIEHSYPLRTPLSHKNTSWSSCWEPPSDYPVHTDDVVLANGPEAKLRDGSGLCWAHPMDPNQVCGWSEGCGIPKSLATKQAIIFDDRGYPVHPLGRMGMGGRGLWGRWGPNFCVDPIIISWEYTPTEPEALQANKARNWRVTEEPGTLKDMWSNGKVVYEGLGRDQRDTDNAWGETTGTLFMCSPKLKKKIKTQASDDAVHCDWYEIKPKHPEDPSSLETDMNLFAFHGPMLMMAYHEAKRMLDEADKGQPKTFSVLLITRRHGGMLAFPGGIRDEGETVPQATLREVQEETCIREHA